MTKEKIYNLRQDALDQMAYIHIYAPDFPNEDKTDLAREKQQLQAKLDSIETTLKTEDQQQWFHLATQEITNCFNAFKLGDKSKGCKEIQSAIEHLKRSFSRKKTKIDFIVGSSAEQTNKI